MNVDFKYLGRSRVEKAGTGTSLLFSPNLARPKVFFDSALRNPVRFREAVSALHDVVVGDLRFKKKDKSAYQAWKQQQAEEEARLRGQVFAEAKKAEMAKIAKDAPPPGLEAEFRKMHDVYWKARRTWARELAANDPELFRHLVPCDPIVTVGPDVVFFECFAKDESSYGCLSVDRGAFDGHQDAGLGTTNVDYSLALYEHFQTLRSYRKTRLVVDPAGFEVQVEGREEYREEKIDLPPSWLRGFGQLQAAMAFPMERIVLPVETVYSILAYLARHREKSGPRSLRFLLTPGQPVRIVLEPWQVVVEAKGPAWSGEAPQEIKVWGRRRLFALARLLPLAERFEVALLGSGLPSIWIAHLGEMRFTLALSGWTTNDWTSGSNLDLLAGSIEADVEVIDAVGDFLEEEPKAKLAEIAASTRFEPKRILPALHHLAKRGQLVNDFVEGCVRWRPILSVPLSEKVLGPEHPELIEARKLHQEKKVQVRRKEQVGPGRTLQVAKIGGESTEAIFDLDGKLSKARCSCSYYRKSALRAGPCRHLLALRFQASEGPARQDPFAGLFARLVN